MPTSARPMQYLVSQRKNNVNDSTVFGLQTRACSKVKFFSSMDRSPE